MNEKVALGLAIACGGLAVAIVAVDLAFSLEVRFEVQEDGEWRTLASSEGRYDYPYEPGGACGAGPYRIVIDNGQWLPVSGRLLVTAWENGTQLVFIDEEVDVGGGDVYTRSVDGVDQVENAVSIQFGDYYVTGCQGKVVVPR